MHARAGPIIQVIETADYRRVYGVYAYRTPATEAAAAAANNTADSCLGPDVVNAYVNLVGPPIRNFIKAHII